MMRRTYCAVATCFPGLLVFAEAEEDNSAAAAFRKALAKIRVHEYEMRQRWIRDEENWRKLPARAWPEYQPHVDEIPFLRSKAKDSCKKGDSLACRDANFNLATALLFNHVDHNEGLKLYELLAAGGDVRGMTAVGICLTEGFGADRDEKYGSMWLKKASKLDFAQGIYELATLHYTGAADPHVKEDVSKAFELFQKAAAQEHTSALFMVADMLMSGEGTNKDYARAVGLLYRSGERGHRFARSTLLRLLKDEKKVIDELNGRDNSKPREE